MKVSRATTKTRVMGNKHEAVVGVKVNRVNRVLCSLWNSLEYPGSCSGKRLRVEFMLVLKDPRGLRGALVPIPRLPT